MQTARIATRHLDGLRIVAAGAVVILHYADYTKADAVGRFVHDHSQHLNLFVDLFFVISGFVIASQYLGKVGDFPSINRFMWRRLARIYPLHLLTLAFYLALLAAAHAGFTTSGNPARYPLSDLPAQLLLLHALIGERLTFNFPSWSLSAEMFCYAIFPFVAAIAIRRRAILPALVAALIVANSLFAAATGQAPWAEWINHGGVFRAFPAFILGVACSLYRDRIAGWRLPPATLAAALIVFVLFGWSVPPGVGLGWIYLIALLAIFCDCSGQETIVTRLKFDRWSHLTYSSYMLHIPVATVVISFGARIVHGLPGGQLALVPVAILVLTAASMLSYRFFETPARNALNDAFDRWRSTRVSGLAIPSGRESR